MQSVHGIVAHVSRGECPTPARILRCLCINFITYKLDNEFLNFCPKSGAAMAAPAAAVPTAMHVCPCICVVPDSCK